MKKTYDHVCTHFSTGMVRMGDEGWDCSEPPSCELTNTYAPDLDCTDCPNRHHEIGGLYNIPF